MSKTTNKFSPEVRSRAVNGRLRLTEFAQPTATIIACRWAPSAASSVPTLGRAVLAATPKLAEAAERSWRRLDGHNQLPKLILGVRFADRIEVVRSQAQAAA
jgi:hypothetical protein